MSWRLKRLRRAYSIQIGRSMLKILGKIFTLETSAALPDIKCLWLGELRNLAASTSGIPAITYQGGSRRCPTGICKQPMSNFDKGLDFLSKRHRKLGRTLRVWRQCRADLIARQQMALPGNDDLLMLDALYAVRMNMRKLCGFIRDSAESGQISANDIKKLERGITALNADIRLIIESFDLQRDFLNYK